MNSIVPYFFLGVSLATPIGPVKATLLNTGIKNGFFHAWFFGLGAVVTDILYMVMVYFGIGHFIEIPFIKTLLWSFGFFVLMYTGIENLLTLHTIEVDSKFGKVVRLRHSLLSGFLMALLNPLTILFWLGIYGSVLVGGAGTLSGMEIILYSVFILLGISLVDLIMATISGGSRKILSSSFLKIVSIISSLSMIGFGIYFGIQAYHSIF
ncbi:MULTISPECIES: LysE family transporter [unclassified Viridibacillus]|uniref:LysE family transporter n=1 Tax=unclassified Viridibacillus TaxID=2617942 RepID=UPI00096EC40F|nr:MULTISPECIES: LysE family transporter [unclassified Viridibacillus]OMC83002.1 amino acid transporter [Viridibacillus sp. FSL H8-0123]OMC88920.1 amino acid transporter [Viridibacillus sp. FSL H7-0596]